MSELVKLTIDGRAITVDEAVQSIAKVREAILTLPFFGGGKLVWWKAVNFFDETGVGRHASVKEALESLQPDLARVDGASVTLLINALGIHKGRSFSKALLKLAQAVSQLEKRIAGGVVQRHRSNAPPSKVQHQRILKRRF